MKPPLQKLMKANSEPGTDSVHWNAAEHLRGIIDRNRHGNATGTYAVCSAHPAVIEAAIQQALQDGSYLHVESTSSQVNQFGGYTAANPQQFAESLRLSAKAAGLPPERVLLGADHLGPFPWREEQSSVAMSKACDLARCCVRAGYQKIHLDASMPCADDPRVLDEKVIAERAAMLCAAAEETLAELPEGSTPPLYVVGTEVPPPGGELAEGGAPLATKTEDVQRTLEAFSSAFRQVGLSRAWENVIALVVQPGVEFGDSSVFDYDSQKASHLSTGLPKSPRLAYEAHSTDYQLSRNLIKMVKDHFAILKVGPWLTFAYREAIFALSAIENEILAPKRSARLSQVRKALEHAMLSNPVYWRAYYQGTEDEVRFSRMFSLSDRCRYYWTDASVQEELSLLLHNLHQLTIPLTLLSQFLPAQYEAARKCELVNSAESLISDHIRRVLQVYSTACGTIHFAGTASYRTG
jgi:D-tagatose-1,6-bisphosphate aldolase subunit GatZ/KbaZ